MVWFVLTALLRPAAAEDPAAADRPLLLWEVTRGGATAHVMGTCPVQIPLAHALPAPHVDALRGARALYVDRGLHEVTPGTLSREAAAEVFGAAVLREQIGGEAFRGLSVRARGTLTAPMLDHTPPALALAMTRMLLPTASSVPLLDQVVRREAAAHGVEILDLDTPATLAALLSGEQPAAAAVLGRTGDPLAIGFARERTALSRCLAADLDGLLTDEVRASASERARIGAQSRGWMAALEPALSAGGAFVAVDARVLPGEEGLLSRLDAAGFSLTAQRTSAPAATLTIVRPADLPPQPSPDELQPWTDAVFAARQDRCEPESFLMACDAFSKPKRCRERLRTDIELCVAQMGDLLSPFPEGGLSAPQVEAFDACMVSGLGLSVALRDPKKLPEGCAE